jgi:hypothetical protein
VKIACLKTRHDYSTKGTVTNEFFSNHEAQGIRAARRTCYRCQTWTRTHATDRQTRRGFVLEALHITPGWYIGLRHYEPHRLDKVIAFMSTKGGERMTKRIMTMFLLLALAVAFYAMTAKANGGGEVPTATAQPSRTPAHKHADRVQCSNGH